MKTTKSLLLTLTLALFTTFAFSQATATTTLMSLTTTAHNFEDGTSGLTFAAQPGEGVCNVCHTPHNSDTQLPLWDHSTSTTPIGNFLQYNGGETVGTINGTFTLAGSASLLCLGCHDGASNLDAYGGSAGALDLATAAVTNTNLTYANFGVDLSNDHPIGITYVDGGNEQMVVKTTSAGIVGMTGTIEELMLTNGTTVDCSSCHSLHNPAGGVAKALLRKDNTGSALCLTCHVK